MENLDLRVGDIVEIFYTDAWLDMYTYPHSSNNEYLIGQVERLETMNNAEVDVGFFFKGRYSDRLFFRDQKGFWRSQNDTRFTVTKILARYTNGTEDAHN